MDGLPSSLAVVAAVLILPGAGGAIRAAPAPVTIPERVPVSEIDHDALVRANTRFALDLYATLCDESAGNVLCSPFSVSTALAMTFAGAREDTAEQMARTLHFDLVEGDVHAAFTGLATVLPFAAEDDAIPRPLAGANRLWGQEGEPFLQTFLDEIQTHYAGNFKTVDFGDPEGARLKINGWTARQTRDRISDLLLQCHIRRDTVLVLTNALHFDGTWRTRFDPEETRQGEFHVAGARTVRVPMMSVTAEFGYGEHDLLHAISLPYDDDRLEMIVLLPRARKGLTAVESALTTESLADWTDGLQRRSVAVTFPRFRTASRFELAEPLKEMGMPDAFGGAADFSGINGRRDLFITDVVHETLVEVDEAGTEAAAATAVVLGRGGATAPPAFIVDRPFIYLIRDRTTGSILFLGRLVDPGREAT